MFGHRFDSFKRKENSQYESTPAVTNVTFPNNHLLAGYVITILTKSAKSTERSEAVIGSIIESMLQNETPDFSCLINKTYRVTIAKGNEFYSGIDTKERLKGTLKTIIQTSRADKENQAPEQNNNAKRLKTGPQ